MQKLILLLLCISFISSQHIPLPTQIHLALTGKDNEMSIMFITPPPLLNINYYIHYGYKSLKYIKSKRVKSHLYRAGSYEAIIHQAVLSNLQYNSTVYFNVGSIGGFTKEYSFHNYPYSSLKSFSFLVYGDMDIGYDARKTVEALKKQENYNFILHTGDLPYAWKGQENKWDEWGRLVEPLSSKVPYMVTPGNHEDNYNFMSYKNRFSNITGVNSLSNNNLYYSFNYGHIHFISISSEHPYYKNSRQYNWLVNDLKNVNRNKYPFIFIFTHKTPYSSNQNHGSDLLLRDELEPLFIKYKVDIIFYGHVHAYERTCPVKRGECSDKFTDPKIYDNPDSPIHITVGTAGYTLNPDWDDPQPNWSVFRHTEHGFLRINVNHNRIEGKFFDVYDKLVDSFVLVKNVQ